MERIRRLLGLEPTAIKLLRAAIQVDEEFRYFVSFQEHRHDLQPSEYVRLGLHYYAKMLFIPDPTLAAQAEATTFLRDAMGRIVEGGISVGADLLHASGIDDVASFASSPPTQNASTIVADLYFVDAVRRRITTEIPKRFYLQQTTFSAIILLQALLTRLDDDCIWVLGAAFENMKNRYDAGQSCTDVQNLIAVPTDAYCEAVMGR
jgi:hypothetical protein